MIEILSERYEKRFDFSESYKVLKKGELEIELGEEEEHFNIDEIYLISTKRKGTIFSSKGSVITDKLEAINGGFYSGYFKIKLTEFQNEKLSLELLEKGYLKIKRLVGIDERYIYRLEGSYLIERLEVDFLKEYVLHFMGYEINRIDFKIGDYLKKDLIEQGKWYKIK